MRPIENFQKDILLFRYKGIKPPTLIDITNKRYLREIKNKTWQARDNFYTFAYFPFMDSMLMKLSKQYTAQELLSIVENYIKGKKQLPYMFIWLCKDFYKTDYKDKPYYWNPLTTFRYLGLITLDELNAAPVHTFSFKFNRK